MPRDLFQHIESNRFVLGDGAMGTMLQQMGLTTGGAPELWNVERPDIIKQIYQSYVDAGSQIIETNTFGGTRYRLKLHNLQDRVRELNYAGAALAREAAGDDVFVAGSMGPTGELMQPMGELTYEDAVDAFAEQAAALAEGGVDLFLIETMSDLNEVKAAVEGCQRVSDLPIATTMTFDTNYHTMMGVSPAQAVRELTAMGVKIIGANCGNGPDEIRRVVREMLAARPEGVYIYAQSNAGLPHYDHGHIHYDGTPEVMAELALELAGLGVDIIGACCGSTPEHIRAMNEALHTQPIPEIKLELPPEITPQPPSTPQRERRERRRGGRRRQRDKS
ncbi:MAG TPA: betaine--homocysteine S-methyltransferase [Caldilineae bacterium]|nr:betaine--homocysteine S-methyltransferase [Caldilineae bacterium]